MPVPASSLSIDQPARLGKQPRCAVDLVEHDETILTRLEERARLGELVPTSTSD